MSERSYHGATSRSLMSYGCCSFWFSDGQSTTPIFVNPLHHLSEGVPFLNLILSFLAYSAVSVYASWTVVSQNQYLVLPYYMHNQPVFVSFSLVSDGGFPGFAPKFMLPDRRSCKVVLATLNCRHAALSDIW